MLTNLVQGLTLGLLIICTKIYICDYCEVLCVYCTFS